ncbi:glycosyltransferase [Streptococcus thermophilus]|uniref:Eps4J n=1 Tax=Streptococcus thermophilus TaxID=1308 RepID=Q8GPF0_STRTR|nr:Eps4J [Streptococcus thermophilus]MCE2121790.1 glycosyltransferase [Streptococcus thermophilus]MCE2128646.1 glycosyltransferase [Streptococcus thermophilus]MCE2136199.1 glycosyltransferase [Streptococcus thermophilus]
MKTSVIIATYNGSKFIEEQFDSILAQSVQPDEVVITDDGSKDNTREVVQRYIDEHDLNKKWHLHVNEKNKGYARNFLDGAMLTTGDIVFFCDQDDIWISDRVKKMSEVMEKNPKINLLCSNLEPFYYEEDTRKWSEKDLKAMKTDGSLEICDLTPEYFHLKRSGCTMCIRKTFLEEIMPYWTANWPHDDFVWKMAVISSSCAILHFVSMRRRMHSNNATVIRVRTRDWRIKQLHEYQMQYTELKKYAQKYNVPDTYSKIIDKNIKSIKQRISLVEHHNLFAWPILAINFKECYPRKKGLYLDGYLSIMKEYKGI